MSDYDFEEMLAYFNSYDRNKTGLLEFPEFAALVNSLGLNFSEEQLKEGFKKVDRNGDGYIEFDEFNAWWGEQD